MGGQVLVSHCRGGAYAVPSGLQINSERQAHPYSQSLVAEHYRDYRCEYCSSHASDCAVGPLGLYSAPRGA